MPSFDELVIAVLDPQGRRTLGNVDFWVDADGPWAGRLAYSIPTARWDLDAVKRDLAAALALLVSAP